MPASLEGSLEALETLQAEKVTQENYLQVLQMAATNFDEGRVEFVKEVISKFEVQDKIITSIFNRAAVPALIDEPRLRKCLKARQDSLYRLPNYQYSCTQPLGFVELLGKLNTDSSWAGLENLVGQYSLDSTVVLGMLFEQLGRSSKFEWFEKSFKESSFKTEQLLSLIHWSLSNLSDWEPTLYAAAGLVGRLFEVEDIYVMFGPDSDYPRLAEDDWENQLIASSGSSQFNALMRAGSLDGDGSQTDSDQVPVVRQRAAFTSYLAKFNHKDVVMRLIKKFPFMVQMNDSLADYANQELLKDLSNKELMHILGPAMGLSHNLIVELCKVFTDYEQFRLWLLPTISLTNDPKSVDAIWSVLSKFSEDERYALYTEWQFSLPRYHKSIKYALKAAEKKTQSILKRISNENVREMLKQFSDIAVSNPFSVFTVFISQVESYDKIGKLILQEPQFNKLSWDVIPLVVLVQLSTGRSQQGGSGLHLHKWAQALSKFTSHLAAGHAEFDCSKLLKFILKQFHQNNFDNVVLLKDLFLYMGGGIDMTEVSYADIRALGASKAVSEDTKRRLFVNMPSEAVINRLLDALIRADVVLEMYLGLVFAKKRRVADAGIASPKVLGHMYDETNYVLQQYSTLLSRMQTKDFEKYIPGVASLVNDYAVPVNDAMNLWRPVLAERVRTSESSLDGAIPRDLQPIVLGLPTQPSLFSNSLYVAGWTLEPYDINVPHSNYSRERKADQQKHELMRSKCLQRLGSEQGHWFNPPDGSRHTQMLQFLTKIVIPRALCSSIDAVFASDFIFLLHQLGVVHFSTLSCLKTLFSGNMLYNTIISSTAIESECLSWFLNEIFTRLNSCTQSDSTFRDFRGDKTVDDTTSYTAALLKSRDENLGSRETSLDKLWSRREVYTAASQWASRLTENLADALGKDDYSTVRNAISILKVNLKVLFQITLGQLKKVQSAVELLKQDKRADIVLAATALSSQLQRVKELSLPWKESPQPSHEDEQQKSEEQEATATERANDYSTGTTPKTPESTQEISECQAEANSSSGLPSRPLSPAKNDWLLQRERQKQEGRARGDRRDGRGRIRDSVGRSNDSRGNSRDSNRDRRDYRDRDRRRWDSSRARDDDRRDRRGRERDAPLPPPPPRDSKRSRLN